MSPRRTFRHARSLGRGSSTVIILTALALLRSAPGEAQAPVARHPGAWTPAANPAETFIPVHIVLLPSSDPAQYHSKILWWNDSHGGTGVFGGEAWKWTPAVQNNCSTYPAANFVEVPLAPPDPRIFCSGFAPMRGPGGRLFISGGAEGIEFGSHDNIIYDAATDGWTSGGFMQGYRWYPTVTTLSDGRALIMSGSKYNHAGVFGGKESPAASPHGELNRFVGNLRGVWDAAIPPGGNWPVPRSYHAAAGGMLIIGGEGADGIPRNDVWELKVGVGNLTDAEPAYSWQEHEYGFPKPSIRRRLAAVATYGDTVWAIGGLGRNAGNTADEVKGDVWRLVKNAFDQWRWTPITVSGDGPGLRFGHTAVFDRARNRILVFGGAAAVNGAAVDNDVFALDLKVQPLQWARLVPRTAARPPARLGHGMLYDRWPRLRANPLSECRAILFGGESQFGSGFLNDVWHLWIDTPGKIEWVPVTITNPGATPTPRSWFGATLDDTGVRLIVYGGATGTATVADGQVHTLDLVFQWPGYDTSSWTWRTMASQAFGLTGQTMQPVPFLLFERRPEIVVPGDSTTWQQLPPRLFIEWYPFVFSMPNGNAFVAGPSILQDGTNSGTYQINVTTGQWTQLPAGSGSGFKGGSAAMYLPGKILKCGSRETEYYQTAVATTKIIDLNIASPVWQSSPAMSHPRVFHNLTLLPGGDILVTGGLGQVFASQNTDPVFEPELWHPPDPQYPADSQGVWYSGPGGLLAATTLVRGYHSVALLLPDGRILNSGGNDHPDATTVSIYCPPYLFKADGQLATRPQINDAPSEIRWGQTFTVCVADTADIRGACLIRPGAVTHGFDQNQRYVPLQIAGHAGSPKRLFLTAPANAFAAPPGYYLLFLTGSADGADVPSIAKWVRLDSPGDADLCDQVAPAPITDFTPDVVGSTEVWFTWTGPGDDDLLTASGPPAVFDLRGSTDESVPGFAGSPGGGSVTGLNACSWNYFTVSAWDDNQHESTPVSVAVETMCGPGGGGLSAHRVEGGEEGASPLLAGAAPAGAEALEPGLGLLITETRRAAEGAWRVSLHLATEADGFAPAGSEITVERESSDGERDTLGRFTPAETENLLGLCALRERGRVAIPGFLGLERVMAHFRQRAQDYVLVDARHSRLGPLGAEFIASGGSPELLAGDVVDLTYAVASHGQHDVPSWYLLVRRQGTAPPIPFSQRRSLDASLPASFALHQSEPNPAGTSTIIRFDLPLERPVKLEVFDLLGRRVATLADRTYSAGSHVAEWNLRDASGAAVRPGVYAYRIMAGAFRARGKMSAVP